jgi:MFS family permease
MANILSWLRGWPARAEMLLVGPLPPGVRRSMYVDLRAACAACVFAATINFIPVILRRLGASDTLIAVYYAINSIGLITTTLGVWLMRRWGTIRVALFSWIVGRGSFLVAAFAPTAAALVAILSVFWLLESWPGPAYVQALQANYPASQRGRIMALVRVGLVAVILIVTPLAGWILDGLGHRFLLPLAALSGVASAVLFYPFLRSIPKQETKLSAAPSAAPLAAGSSWLPLLADRRMLLYLAGSLLFGLGVVISAPLFPSVQVDRLNLSYTVVGLLGFVQSFFWLLGYLFGGRILDRLGGIRSLQIAFLINAAVMLPYVVASQGWMLLPAFAAAGLVAASSDLATLYTLIDLAGPAHAQEVTALNATFAGIRGLLGPFIGPLLVQAGWPLWSVFVLCSVLTVAGAGVLAFIF